jgi:hypothetical protein
MARKYFGSGDAPGGVLELDRKTSIRVGAVIEDLPANTHLKIGMVLSTAPGFWINAQQARSLAQGRAMAALRYE